VLATVSWLRGEPWADARLVLLVGQSVGGLATVAAAAQHPAGVVGYVNFAGGTGGNPEHSPGRSCDPDQLTRLYAAYGRATTIPNLWVYAENDQYWGAAQPATWHAAFAGGSTSRTTFVHAAPVPDGDGHGLSRHASRLWAPTLDAFVSSIGFATR
jgi:dienelactone hydrolase